MMTSIVSHKRHTLDFGDFYEAWLPKVERAVVVANFSGEEAKDLVQDIFLDLLSRNLLANFDSEKSVFSTYVWSYVLYVIKGRKQKLVKRTQNEYSVSSIDESDGNDSGEDRGAEALLSDDRVAAEFAETDLSLSLQSIHKQLRDLPKVRANRLANLFFDIVEDLKLGEIYSQEHYALKEGIKRQAINKRLQILRNTVPLQELYAILMDVEL